MLAGMFLCPHFETVHINYQPPLFYFTTGIPVL